MEPIEVVGIPPPAPAGNPLSRALRAVVLERRLPYTVAIAWDRLCRRLGMIYKTVPAAGFRVRLRRLTTDCHFVEKILIQEEYLLPGYDLRRDDVVIDVGANIGTFALLAASKIDRGRIYAFEPVKENFRLLMRNLSQNHLADRVVAQQRAILGRERTVRIFMNAKNTGRHSILAAFGTDPGWYEEVEGITLARVFEENGIDRCSLLKLDCEGAEFEILREFPATYFPRIDRIVMEYHATSTNKKRREGGDLVQYLQNNGFTVERYTDDVGFNSGHIWARRIDGR